ncbi:MAG: hypothetical protein K2X42_07195, partial [Burkholderiaceae bacterium]|nr:hypothetical protein [Burkholderiaceae bacterium]
QPRTVRGEPTLIYSHSPPAVGRFRCLWVLAWAFVKSAPEIGGRDTQVKLALGVFGELLINKWVYLLIAGLCGGGWWMNRRVYRGRISEMADQIKAMEQQIDPGRRGSGLDKQGQSKADR